mmetsp:Transcript_87143/g.174354  ORF Transcript_87143/g.174354 Transcript_87143/m.174354 type:complete len:86 (+) Transcript_87143:238-495(+)
MNTEKVYHGNAAEEVSEFLTKLGRAVDGKLIVDDDSDTEDGYEVVPDENRIYHGGVLQEVAEFLKKIPEIISGKLIVADAFDEDQ